MDQISQTPPCQRCTLFPQYLQKKVNPLFDTIHTQLSRTGLVYMNYRCYASLFFIQIGIPWSIYPEHLPAWNAEARVQMKPLWPKKSLLTPTDDGISLTTPRWWKGSTTHKKGKWVCIECSKLKKHDLRKLVFNLACGLIKCRSGNIFTKTSIFIEWKNRITQT